jgi:hypothetical protein
MGDGGPGQWKMGSCKLTFPQMKLIAAYLLLQLGGNASPSAEDIKSLLETVGVEAEQERLDKLISELEGKDINEVSEAPRLKWQRKVWRGPQLWSNA